MTQPLSLRALSISLFALVSPLLCANVFAQEESADSKSGYEAQEILGTVAVLLKAAVRNGDMSKEDGVAVWVAFESEYESSVKDADDEESDSRQQSGVSSLRKIGDIRTLMRPEFMSRDITLLQDELNLDQDQMILVETLLQNYMELFDMVSDPLKEAMSKYEGDRQARWVGRALSRVNLTENLENALDKALSELSEKEEYLESEEFDKADRGSTEEIRGEIAAYRERLGGVYDTIGDRIVRLRGEYETRLQNLERPSNLVTGDDLVRLARNLRDERERLRLEFVEYLELITKGSRDGQLKRRIDSTIDRIRIEHNVAGGLLGGESIDLRALVMKSELPREVENRLLIDLIEIDQLVGNALARRTEKRVDRELLGLELKAKIDEAKSNDMGGWDSLTSGDVRSYVRACRAELSAAIEVRDLTLTYLDICSEAVGIENEAIARRFRDAGLRVGFRMEMREQWAERALRIASELETLDLDRLEDLAEIESGIAMELRSLREEAIEDRIRIDPIRARAMIDQMSEPGVKGEDVYADIRQLFEELYEDYEEVDDQTEAHLVALLSVEEFEQLPNRKRDEKKDAAKAGGNKKGASGKGNYGKGVGGKGVGGKGGRAK